MLFKRIVSLIIALSLAGGVLFWVYKQKPSSQVVEKGMTQESVSSIGGSFDLIDQFGHVRHDREFRGKLMLVYFGYAYCPDICPMALNGLTKVLKDLGKDRDQVNVLFVTCDPKRDTVENLKLYAQNYDPNIIMLTGNELKIERAQKAYKVYAKAAKQENMSDYLVDHSSAIYLMNRDGSFIQMFAHNVDTKKIMKAVQPYLIKKKS